jgi:hypothetical protein
VPADRETREGPPAARPVDRPPLWAVAADVCALGLVASSLFVSAAGRTFLLGGAQLVLPSPPFLLFLSAAMLAIRHVARPRPSLRGTIATWSTSLADRPHLAAACRAFFVTRPLVLLIAYFAVVTFGFPRTVGFTLSSDPLGNLPARFDAGWYGGIALDGYQWDQQFGRQRNIAFFPALPMLMRPVGAAIGMNQTSLPRDKRMLRALWAGVLVSLAAFAWALIYVARLADLLSGPRAAAAAPLLIAAYPFAVFFNAPYTESLFLLGCTGAFYHFHRGDWVRASCFGLLVGFSRPNGCLVSVPLAVLGLEQLWRDSRARLPGASPQGTGPDDAISPVAGVHAVRPLIIRLVVAAMPGLAMLIFTAYLYRLTGVWLAWARMHGAWGRKWGTGPLAQGWEWLTTEGLMAVFQGVPYDTINTLAAIFALALLWSVFRRLGAAYATFVLVNLLPPIFAGGALSMGRVTATLFPLFIALAASVRPTAVSGWAAGFGLLQGFVAAIFFTWRELF